jgi:hypothetical protein
LINGDESGFDDDDSAAMDAFVDDMLATNGECHCIGMGEDMGFMTHHDAQPFGVLACDASEFIFDITKRD